jgi:hypothetical protein
MEASRRVSCYSRVCTAHVRRCESWTRGAKPQAGESTGHRWPPVHSWGRDLTGVDIVQRGSDSEIVGDAGGIVLSCGLRWWAGTAEGADAAPCPRWPVLLRGAASWPAARRPCSWSYRESGGCEGCRPGSQARQTGRRGGGVAATTRRPPCGATTCRAHGRLKQPPRLSVCSDCCSEKWKACKRHSRGLKSAHEPFLSCCKLRACADNHAPPRHTHTCTLRVPQ